MKKLLCLAAFGIASQANAQFNFTFTDFAVTANKPVTDSNGVAVGDFNNDGIQDYCLPQTGGFTLRLVNEDGTYTEVNTSFAGQILDMKMYDLDKDGFLDVIIGGNTEVYAYKGNGSSLSLSFARSASYAYSLEVADINNNGLPEIIHTNASGSVVSILEVDVNSTGDMIYAATDVNVPSNIYTMRLKDYDNDGSLDLLLCNYGSDFSRILWNKGTVENYFENTAGNFSIFSGYASCFGGGSADYNHDGLEDVMLAAYDVSQVVLYKNNGSRTFALDTVISSINPVIVEYLDLNMSGTPFFVISNFGTNILRIFAKGTESTTVGANLNITLPSGLVYHRKFLFEDLNNDGKKDVLLTSDSDNKIYISYNTGTPSPMLVHNETAISDEDLVVIADEIAVGNTESLTFSLINAGTATLGITPHSMAFITLTGDVAHFNVNMPNLPVGIGASEDFTIDFAPTSVGEKSVMVEINAIDFYVSFEVEGVASSPISALNKSAQGQLTLYPNPVQIKAFVKLNKAFNTQGQMDIFDMNGKKLSSQTVPAGQSLLTFETNELPQGTYVVRVSDGKESFEQKFIKK